MSTRNRIIVAALALLTAGTLCSAVYAGSGQNGNQQSATQPAPAQQSTQQNPAVGQAQQAVQQPATQQTVQQSPNQAVGQAASQAQPYRVNMNPGVIEQGQVGRTARQNVDLFLIPCLINANNAEVTLAKIAAQRGQSPEIKNFAQQMIKDHSAGAKDFEQLEKVLTGALHPQNPNNTPVAAALFQINQQIEQNCLADAQRELEQQSGAEFDRCYIGMQVGMHMQLASVISVFKNHATSSEFKKTLDEAGQLVARHLDEAKRIAKDLGQHGGTTAVTR